MPTFTVSQNGVLPEDVKEKLTNWPASGTGTRAVHRYLLSLTNTLRHYVDAAEAVRLLRNAPMPRLPRGREIEETVERAFRLVAPLAANRSVSVPPANLPDVSLIEKIVQKRIGSRSALEQLRDSSPNAIPSTSRDVLNILFPRRSLICAARFQTDSVTKPLERFSRPEKYQFIVPSPMLVPFWTDENGKHHPRGNSNTGPRRFIVTDFDIKPTRADGSPSIYAELIARWNAAGISVQDAAAALISYLSGYGPLVMVAYSGNVSLQAWWYCQGEPETDGSRLRRFFESAVMLGADRAGWIPCQLFRMPLAPRLDSGRIQTVHYLDIKHLG